MLEPFKQLAGTPSKIEAPGKSVAYFCLIEVKASLLSLYCGSHFKHLILHLHPCGVWGRCHLSSGCQSARCKKWRGVEGVDQTIGKRRVGSKRNHSPRLGRGKDRVEGSCVVRKFLPRRLLHFSLVQCISLSVYWIARETRYVAFCKVIWVCWMAWWRQPRHQGDFSWFITF